MKSLVEGLSLNIFFILAYLSLKSLTKSSIEPGDTFSDLIFLVNLISASCSLAGILLALIDLLISDSVSSESTSRFSFSSNKGASFSLLQFLKSPRSLSSTKTFPFSFKNSISSEYLFFSMDDKESTELTVRIRLFCKNKL